MGPRLTKRMVSRPRAVVFGRKVVLVVFLVVVSVVLLCPFVLLFLLCFRCCLPGRQREQAGWAGPGKVPVRLPPLRQADRRRSQRPEKPSSATTEASRQVSTARKEAGPKSGAGSQGEQGGVFLWESERAGEG